MEGFHNDRSIGASAAKPDFQKLSQTIESNIHKISQNVSSMQKMVNQLNSTQDSHDIRSQFQQIQNYTQQLAKDTSSLLKTLMTMTLTPDQRQQKLTREKLGEEFLSALHAFQATQRTAAQKTNEEARKHRPQNIRLPEPFSLGSSNNGELIELEAAAEKRKQQIQIPTEQELRDYEEQEQRVLELERNIVSVNDIFKDLGSIIHDQSAVIDSIEANIENTVTHVESGVEQLRQTSQYQNKLRKKKLILLIIVLVVVAIILIFIFAR